MNDAGHIGFARKYRPQQFKDVVGQDAVATTLKNAVESEKPAQAYLFYGPRGVGKTTSARLLARALNCRKGPAPIACGKCPSCVEIAAGSSIDVLELDAASNTQVDKIREMIIETVALAPSRDRFKVFIIDEVHMLSSSSFNALLKTLEEPPAHAVFVLATTELAKIPATIVSRCQRFRFRPIPRDVMAEYLAKLAKSEKLDVEKEALDLIAGAAGGALRDGVSLLDQAAAFCDGIISKDKVGELMGMLPDDFQIGLARAILGKDAGALAQWLDRAGAEGFDAQQLLRDMRHRFHEMYLDRMGVESGAGESWKELAGEHAPEVFSFLLRRVSATLEDMRKTDSPQLAFELGLFGMLESAYDLRDWVRRLELLENRLVDAGAVAPPPPPAQVLQPAPKPAAAPLPPPRPSAPPAAAPRSSVDVENIWATVLAGFDKDKPALAGSLEGSRLVPNEGEKWKLVFSDAFNRDRADSNRATIEAALSDAAGKRIVLTWDVEKAVKALPKAEKSSTKSPEADNEPAPAVQKILGAFDGSRVLPKTKNKSE